MAPQVILIDSSKKELLKEDLKIFWQKIKDWKCPADQVYR
jgi:hypothetical protein